MNSNASYRYLFLLPIFFVSCLASSPRKSADYYYKNRESISHILELYDTLFAHQPFSAGFSDKSFQYYLMEVTTDSVRYVYNTERNKQQVIDLIVKYGYDTSQLGQMARLMKSIKCLWLSRTSFYVDEKRQTVTFLSFKSAANDGPFVENKYYILLFPTQPVSSASIDARIKKGDLVRIRDSVYFTVGNKFR